MSKFQLVLSAIFLLMIVIGYIGKANRARIISEDSGLAAERKIEREIEKRHREEEQNEIDTEMGLNK